MTQEQLNATVRELVYATNFGAVLEALAIVAQGMTIDTVGTPVEGDWAQLRDDLMRLDSRYQDTIF